MRKKLYIPLLLVTSLLSFHRLYAQEYKLSLITSSNHLSVGEKVEIGFEANEKIDDWRFLDIKGLKFLGGPSTSQSSSWINGKSSKSYKITYYFVAEKKGTYKVGPYVATIKGKKYQSNQIIITVSEQQKIKTKNKNVFIVSNLNKNSCFTGEQLLLTHDLYYKVNISNLSLDQDTKLDGFWTEEITPSQNRRTKVLNGIRYDVITVRQQILSPLKSGNLKIDPLKLKCEIAYKANNGGFFGFGQIKTVTETILSNQIKLKVKPLPKKSTLGFDGQVGEKYSIKITPSKTELKINESLDIQIKISGKGNIKLINEFDIQLPEDFETYDPKITDDIKTTTSGTNGSRTFNYLIIPRNAGLFEIPSINFSYFDISSKKYINLSTKPIKINVLKSDGEQSNQTFITSQKQDINIINSDIRYLHDIKLTNQPVISLLSYKKKNILVLYLFYFFILSILFFTAKKRKELLGNLKELNKRKAHKFTRQFLIEAKKSLDSNNQVNLYQQLSKAIYSYLNYKFDIPISRLNKKTIIDILDENNVSKKSTQILISVLSDCETARFSPINVDTKSLYKQTQDIISVIEKEIKK